MRKRTYPSWLPIAGSLLLVAGLLWLSLQTLRAAAGTTDQPAAASHLATASASVALPAAAAAQPAAPGATNWCVAGSFQGWNNSSTPLLDDGTSGDLIAGDGIYSLDYTIAVTGRNEFKALECGNWGNAYPGENAWFFTSAPNQVVKFTFDTNDRSGDAGPSYVPSQNIVNVWGDDFPTTWTAVGDWQGWNNSDPATAMSYAGNGIYYLTYTIPASGTYEGKVTNDGWTNQVGGDGRSINGANITFQTTSVSETVVFQLDTRTGRLNISSQGSGSGSWCAAGSFQGWNNSSTPMYDDGTNGDLLGGDGIFSLDYTIAVTGQQQFKIVECGNWGNAYPAENAWLFTSVPSQVVKLTFDTNDRSGDAGIPFYPAQNIISVWSDDFPTTWTAVGDWQGWNNSDPATAMTDLGNRQYYLTYTIGSAGAYQGKVTNDGWNNQVGADGRSVNAPAVPFTTTADGSVATFWLDGSQGRIAIDVQAPASVIPPIDPSLINPAVQHPIQDEVFYFLLPDRYQNGDPLNDTGNISGTVLDHGYLPTDKGYYHGGDLSGLTMTSTLDYIEGLGVSAIWLTPVFGNDPVQGDGTIGGSSAAYHGYWIVDYTGADAHLGTDQELVNFISAAHARGIKVFFDIVTNHTGDIIQYQEGIYDYRNKTDYPYRDANGVVFDDRTYVLSGTFPTLDPATSFPYTPFVDPGNASVKKPDWLNTLYYYHNRGNSSFAGESSTYGDFFGLDDLFTEHPDVVTGFVNIFTNTISTYDIDGFRLDTVKHVNIEFWQQVAPAVMNYATNNGKPDFFMFGEVFDYSASLMSKFTTEGGLQSVLDFGIQGNAYGFAINSEPTANLQSFFEADDYFTDADSNAYQLANFISNHDIGRFGGFIRNELGGTPNAEWLDRSELGHALIYFARGFPVVYYGDEQGFVSDGGDKDAREDMFPSQVAEYNDNILIGTSATTADNNFDNTHPLYQTLVDYATVYSNHLALRRGAQIHRYSQGSAGLYAFSRIDATEQVEYIVALNNSSMPAAATFEVYEPNMGFTAVYPLTSTDVLTSDAGSMVTVTVPAFGVAIYRADAALSPSTGAPGVNFNAPAPGATLLGRVEVGVTLTDTNQFVEVNFAVKIGDGNYQYVGTDNNAPYRVFYDVSGIAPGTAVTFQAIVNDLNGNYTNNIVSGVVGDPGSQVEQYAIIHYHRFNGDYGDFSSNDFNDFWGLHLWGGAVHPDDLNPSWPEPKKFSGIDEYGAYVALRIVDDSQLVNFIVHKGDVKDPGDIDRNFDPAATPEIWLVEGTYNIYTSAAEALGQTLIHYNRADNTYTDWGLHLWQDGSPPFTTWPTRHLPTSFDNFGAVFSITTNVYPSLELTRGLNFIVHNGMGSQEPQRTYTPTHNYEIWVNDTDTNWYDEEGAAAGFATIHYLRCRGDYGDYSSSDFNDFWGLHLWTGALTPTQWTEPLKPISQDGFGVVFEIPLAPGATDLNYILHRGDLKDVPPDQSLSLTNTGYEIWIVEGDGGNNALSAGVQFTEPSIAFNVAGRVCGTVTVGDISLQSAYWLAEDVIGWDPVAWTGAPISVTLHYTPNGGLTLDSAGISGGSVVTLTPHPMGSIGGSIANKFPHLRGIGAWQIEAGDVPLVPSILKGQIAIAAHDAGGNLLDATGLQIPGVLDDMYTYTGTLGIEWAGISMTPTVRLWAPTAKSVTLHLFNDALSSTSSITYPMMLDPNHGVWSVTGPSSWAYQYYLYEVEVYVHSTGQVEHNIVTDPYAVSLAMNSARSQMVDLSDPLLEPAGWSSLTKPPLAAPEDITVYELHVRDFSVSDPLVAQADQGTFAAFTYDGQNGRPGPSNGMQHLLALQQAGLSHVHLLPVFDIATINEDKSQWATPVITPGLPPTSTAQQAAVSAVEDQDAFNWGYDPFHYSVPEGSYSTNPTGTQRIVEFREMVQTLNENGLRVVMDVVYNHTNASGQNPKSVLDQIVPGYYHRLNATGQVERSTCCENTASEHNMMEKLMVDSLMMWATAYKVDAFRFDLMGHHMITNMVNIRTSLDSLTLGNSGVNGSEIYLYGEGWNFGEVANNARGINATQLNMAGTGIGTFSDRLRDAVRGGGPFDDGDALKTQGFANGLYYDPNNYSHPFDPQKRLLTYTDWIRAGLAGNLADYAFVTANDKYTTAANIDYNGQPAGYTADPQEQIIYISKHDNQTLFDINVYAMPTATTSVTDRVRAQNVGLSIVSLSQGVPFFHAGSDMLRSKSLDRDSFNSGDWFNRLDFTYSDNNYGVGLPVASKNGTNWPVMIPYLADATIYPATSDISFMSALFREWMAIRSSSELFRLETAVDVQQRLAFHNTGSAQIPGLVVMSLSDAVPGLPDIDPNHEFVVVLFNANDAPQTIPVTQVIGMNLDLHPVQQQSADAVVRTATFDPATGTFSVPGRTTAVFVARVVAPQLALNGPAAGFTGVNYTFTATVQPVSVTAPVTLTWQADEQMTQTMVITAAGSYTMSYNWALAGGKGIRVAAENVAGTAIVLSSIAISESPLPPVPPQSVTLAGRSSGLVNVGYPFTATVAPVSTTMPVTITWTADDLAPVTSVISGTLSDVQTFTWASAGVKQIVVTAANAAGTVSDTHTITIAAPVSARLQVVHLAPFAPGDAAVDVYLDGTAVLTDFGYNTSSGYLTVTAGTYLVELNLAGTMTTAVSTQITLTAGSDNTALAIGGANSWPLELRHLVDNVVTARDAAADAYLRLGHVAPFDPVSLQTEVNVIDEISGTVLYPNVAYGDIFAYQAFAAGTYDLRIELASDDSLLFDLVPVTLVDGEFITVLAAGDGVDQATDVVAVTGASGELPSLLAPVYTYYMPVIFSD